MDKNKIQCSECLRIFNIEERFLQSLDDLGLIEIVEEDKTKYIDNEQIKELEQYSRWFYDMKINIEGIDALSHMVERVKMLHEEINRLTSELRFYRTD